MKAGLPPLPRRHVSRGRLTRRLDEVGARAVVVFGPAGYGKTTLATEWAQGREGIAWFRVTPASADLAGFALGVGEAAACVIPLPIDRLRQQLKVAAGPAALAEVFARTTSEWPAEAVLVLDDYHVVRDERVHAFLEELLTRTGVRLLVTGRRRPPWASARRVVSGEVVELGGDELAMTNEEAAAVLVGHSPKAVRALVDQARGWPAVIALAAISASRGLPKRAVATTLYRYFADEVLNAQPPEIRRFMLEASIGSAIRGERTEAPAVDRLIDEGLLTRESRELFFHPLLRDFLRRKLRAQDPQRAAELLEQAISDARSEHRAEEAFELAANGGLIETAVEVAREEALRFMETGRVELLERWLAICGPAAFRHPELLLAKMAVLFHDGRFSDVAALGADLVRRAPSGHPTISGAWYRRAQALHMLAERDGAMDAARNAYETATTPLDRRKGLLLAALTAARLELDEVDEYLVALSKLDEEIDDRLRFAAALLVAEVKSGTLAGAWARTRPLVMLAASTNSPMLRSHVLACAAYLHVLRADYARARQFADEALRVCSDFSISFAYDTCLIYRAFADIGQHHFKDARERLREAQWRGRGREDHDFHLQRKIAEIKLDLARGETSAARPLDPQLEAGATRAYVGEYYAYAAVAAGAAGDREPCAAAVARTRELTRSAEATYYADFAELIAELAAGREVEARAVELVRKAERAEVVDAFVVAYRAYPPLLALAARNPETESLARRITAQAGDQALARDAGLSSDPSVRTATVVGLTPREEDVLQLLGQGLTNAEIAERLVISLSTVKIHVHNILRKFDASSRLEAVVIAARAAGLEERPAAQLTQ
jgi:ATP/maltotriose-dependent transcriptional regulator MalT